MKTDGAAVLQRCRDSVFPYWYCHRVYGHDGPCALTRWWWWRRVLHIKPERGDVFIKSRR